MKTAKLTTAAITAAMALFATGAFAASVKIDSVTQRWPWNNKVDIKYTVNDGQVVAEGKYRRLEFTANIGGTSYTIDGNTLKADTTDGQHVATWTPPADLKVKSDSCTMSVALYASDVPSGDDYMVIDLGTGKVTYEGLCMTQDLSNERYTNNVAYKTTSIVLRKVPKGGSYVTGSTSGSFTTSNSKKTWTTDKDYYIGIFEVTQSQYENLVGSNPSEAANKVANSKIAGDNAAYHPVDSVSWDTLRASAAPDVAIPVVSEPETGSFFQRLNYLTSNTLAFDLPTEVMFEIAQRSGKAGDYFWTAQYPEEGQWNYQKFNWDARGRVDGSTYRSIGVGNLRPTLWGLFDVGGNVLEWCRDDDGLANQANALNPWTPSSTSSTRRRVRGAPYFGEQSGSNNSTYTAFRGGSVDTAGTSNGGASSTIWTATTSSKCIGFRVSVILK